MVATRFALAALAMVCAACTQSADSITIELNEVNGSGISGVVRLEPAGRRATRIRVVSVEGGDITGARVMPGRCDAGPLDDKHPITPPSGIVQLDFESLREWSEQAPIAAAFMGDGRHVACGES